MLGRPWILRSFFLGASLAWFARIALSGICSIRPAPKTGVGIRKITLRRASSRPKSGCASAHPGASERPAIVNRSWTPPSGVPSAFFTNLASRTGPFGAMNDGTVLVAPSALANSTWGFTGGLDPPSAGCRWQPPQLPRFIVGPRPSPDSSSSANSSVPALKNASSVLLSPAMGAPAPAAPPRTPGSRAAEDESSGDGNSSRKRKKPTTASISSATTSFFMATPFSPRKYTPRSRILFRGKPACQRTINDIVISRFQSGTAHSGCGLAFALARRAQDVHYEEREAAGEENRRAPGIAEGQLAHDERGERDPREDAERKLRILDEQAGDLPAGGGEPFHSALSPRASGAAFREILFTAAAAAARKNAAMPRIARSSPGQ